MTGESAQEGSLSPTVDGRAPRHVGSGPTGYEDAATLTWVSENLAVVRRSASGQRVLYWVLAIGSVVGLAAHVGGFLLKSSATAGPLLLVGDLLYSLGMALWTGIVVALFVQVWPAAKKRQFREVLDAYEAAAGRQAVDGSAKGPASAEDA